MDYAETRAVGIWHNPRHALPMFFATSARAQTMRVVCIPQCSIGEQFCYLRMFAK
jgi:hypothetical protein